MANSQTDPVVGFDGTNYLVVWEDNRFGEATFAARVRRDGTILDGSGFLIAHGIDPAIAFDGENYLVVLGGGCCPETISAYRVSPDGVVLDPGGIGFGGLAKFNPAVAFDGENFIVAYWQDPEYCGCPDRASAIEATLVSPDGVVSRGGTRIARDVAPYATPAIAVDGSNALVVWDHGPWESRDIHGTRVGRSLEVLDGPTGVPISSAEGSQSTPAVAFDGTKYLVVWADGRNGQGTTHVYGARVGRSGVVRDPDGIPISTAPGGQRDPSVASIGRFFVIWRDDRLGPYGPDIYGTRVSGSGAVFEPDGVPIATSDSAEAAPAIIAGPGRRYTVVHQRYTPEDPYGSTRVYLRRIAPK